MSEDRITKYAEAVLAVASAESGGLEVEDELFRFARAVEKVRAARSLRTWTPGGDSQSVDAFFCADRDAKGSAMRARS